MPPHAAAVEHGDFLGVERAQDRNLLERFVRFHRCGPQTCCQAWRSIASVAALRNWRTKTATKCELAHIPPQILWATVSDKRERALAHVLDVIDDDTRTIH